VAAGLWAGDTLDMARVMGMLPFFVLGLKAKPERLEWLRGRTPKLLAVAAFVAIWLLSAMTDRWASTEWLYYRAQYDEFPVSDARAAVTRLVIIAIGTIGTFAFLALVPRVSGWFTRMGAWTLVVYLLHGFVVKGIEYAGFETWATARPWAAFVVTTVGGVALALLLASPPMGRWLQHLVDPFGLAERKVNEAVDLTVAAVDVPEPEPERTRASV
jgi:fucose 4-O-acetylase-like acetyltransferase